MVTKQEILRLSSLPILDVAARLKLDVDRHRHCHCAFHNDSNPSMVLYPDSNRFYCFACQARGGVIDLAMRVLGKGFLDTCTWLASDNELVSYSNKISVSSEQPVFDPSRYLRYFEHPYLNKPACEFLFCQRKLHPEPSLVTSSLWTARTTVHFILKHYANNTQTPSSHSLGS